MLGHRFSGLSDVLAWVLVGTLAWVVAGCSLANGSPKDPEGSSSAAAPPTLARSVAEVKSGVVRIETTYCDGSVASGSGFLIAPDMIVTAAHVIQDAHTISLRTHTAASRGIVVGEDPDRDLAVLRSRWPLPGHTFTFARKPVHDLDEVAILGYPLGLPLTTDAGHVSALNRTIDLEDQSLGGMIQTDAAVNPGNSGGPMVDTRGQVIGVVDAGYSTAQGIAYAIPSRTAAPTVQGWVRHPHRVSTAKCEDPYGDISVTSAHPDAPAIATSLARYFTSLNDHEYADAWGLISGDLRGGFGTFDFFQHSYSTTSIDDVTLESVDMTSETTDTARVRFTSHQAARLGHDGQTCSRWHLDYTMRIDTGFWHIAGAQNLGRSPRDCSPDAAD